MFTQRSSLPHTCHCRRRCSQPTVVVAERHLIARSLVEMRCPLGGFDINLFVLVALDWPLSLHTPVDPVAIRVPEMDGLPVCKICAAAEEPCSRASVTPELVVCHHGVRALEPATGLALPLAALALVSLHCQVLAEEPATGLAPVRPVLPAISLVVRAFRERASKSAVVRAFIFPILPARALVGLNCRVQTLVPAAVFASPVNQRAADLMACHRIERSRKPAIILAFEVGPAVGSAAAAAAAPVGFTAAAEEEVQHDFDGL